MTDSVIFQMQGDKLVEMREQLYDTEALLQDFLSQYPALLAGEQMDQIAPRRWLLVQPEIGVPDQLNGASRWALDHLFLDQDARPTFVEVKRSTNTQIRREVIGQMLDYAANATAYWPGERLRNEFEKRCQEQGDDPEAKVIELLGNDNDVDAFWHRAAENLQRGRLRLLFVADVLPPELRRVVEFLNGAFSDIEVLGVEIKQYKGENALALVPRVIGQTVKAEDMKTSLSSRETKNWTFETCLEDSRNRGYFEVEKTFQNMMSFAKKHGLDVRWGTGKKIGSMKLSPAGTKEPFLYLESAGLFYINAIAVPKTALFDDPTRYEHLKTLFGQIVAENGPPADQIYLRQVREDFEVSLAAFLQTLFGMGQQAANPVQPHA